ncbi:MAG: hypothetical protein AAB875_05025 [Patescibacteria group bacterium]
MSNTKMSPFAETIARERYFHPGETTWADVARRVARTVLGAVDAPRDLVDAAERLVRERVFMPGGRYLYAAGRPYAQCQNCLLLRVEDTREGWGDTLTHVATASCSGAGLGVVYSDLRPRGAPLHRSGGAASGPLPLMHAVNEVGRAALNGGARRAALWAGLHWSHPDVLDFIQMKDWPEEIRALKRKDFSAMATMDHTNISVILDDDFFARVETDEAAQTVFDRALRGMLRTGEPGFSIDVGANARENLRNACTEVCSEDDSDICNLGSINLARVESTREMEEVVEVATAFLLAGTVYSDVPYNKVVHVRAKNRRLGLGLLGIHEWLVRGGHQYGPCEALLPYLRAYERSTGFASKWSRTWNLSAPVKTRAIAPTGTIGIVAETTTGIEPIFAAAYLRRYFDRGSWRAQYVLDPTAKRLVADGVDPDRIEDALSLAGDVDRRLSFQAWMQRHVDHAISSTINLPPWGSAGNDEGTVPRFAAVLRRHLPRLRGVTCYPDGARAGQPIVRVDYRDAERHVGEVLTESVDVCDLRGGGTCGA